MSEYPKYNPEAEYSFDETKAMKELITMHGSIESALFYLEHQIPAMQKELEELQDRELTSMNKMDLDRMTTLERQVPDLTKLLEVLKKAVKPKNKLARDLDSEIQDLGDTVH